MEPTTTHFLLGCIVGCLLAVLLMIGSRDA